DCAADAIVSLDTTQDYHGLKFPGWEPMIAAATKNRKNFTCPILMVADSHATFELADLLQKSRRYYLTMHEMDHDDYISQGGLGKEWRLRVRDKMDANEKAAVERTRRGYQALCAYILRFLDFALKADAGAEDFLAKQYRDTKLGDPNEPHVEMMAGGETSTEAEKGARGGAPTPR